jgi:enamine deaminase RidA (YjgF/YER057c/UK114 family)
VNARVEYLNPEGMATPLGLYSQVSRDSRSGLVFVAGQVALAGDGTFVGEGDLAAQARQTFLNVGAALRGAGADWSDVLRLTTYLTRFEDYGVFRDVRGEIFGQIFPDGRYPPHTLLVVAALSAPEHLIEVDAIAAGPIS